MQNISSDNPQYVLHRFVLWFSLLGVIFFIGLFTLRQDPIGLKVRSFYVPYEQKRMDIPFYFSQDTPQKERRVQATIQITEEFQQPALLIKRPSSYVDVYWDKKRVYQMQEIDGNKAGKMSILIPLQITGSVEKQHLLQIYITGKESQTGLIEHVYIGEHEHFLSYVKRRTSAAIFMISILLLTTFFNLTRYILNPRRRIFFAFGMLFLGFFLVSFSSAEIFFLFHHSVSMMSRVKTAAITVGFGASLWVILCLFPDIKFRSLLRKMAYVFLLFFLCSFLLSFDDLQVLQRTLYLLSIPFISMVLYVFTMTRKDWNQDVKYIVYLSFLIITGGLLDLLAIWGFHQLPPSTPMFSTIFSIGTTIYLSLVDSDLANRYAQMLRHTKDSVVICSQNGDVLESNPVAKSAYCLEHGVNLINFVNKKEEMKEYLRQDMSDRYEFSFFIDNQKIEFESIRVELPTGKLLLTLRDVTSRKILEKEVLKKTKQDTLALVVEGVAHDLNNSLAVVIGQVQLLYPFISKKEHRRIGTIEDLVVSSSKDVLQMLSMIRGSLETPYIQNLVPILEKNNNILQQTMSEYIQLSFKKDTNTIFIFMSATDIQLALLNVMQNAVESLNNRQDGKIWIDVWCTEKQVYIHIENSGTPIPQQIREYIFDPFYTRKAQNHIGIGLTVSQKIIEEHQGTIVLKENKYSSGGCFEIQLPLQTNNVQIEHQTPKKVLLVEDESLILEMMVEILEEIGCIVYSCQSGTDAFTYFEQHRIDILITDVILHRENGIELATELVERNKNLKVLVVSGFIPDYKSQLKEDWYFLQKPFSVTHFMNLVQEMIITSTGR